MCTGMVVDMLMCKSMVNDMLNVYKHDGWHVICKSMVNDMLMYSSMVVDMIMCKVEAWWLNAHV